MQIIDSIAVIIIVLRPLDHLKIFFQNQFHNQEYHDHRHCLCLSSYKDYRNQHVYRHRHHYHLHIDERRHRNDSKRLQTREREREKVKNKTTIKDKYLDDHFDPIQLNQSCLLFSFGSIASWRLKYQ